MPKAGAAPILYILAGANGSGKSTLANVLLKHEGIKEFVNADLIAQGLSPFNPIGQRVSAGKLVIERMNGLIAKGESFAIETTLSGNTLLRHIRAAQKAGYSVKLFYLYIQDVRINLQRIKYRVEQGGHNVPATDVRRRYKRSLAQLFGAYFTVCDIVNKYDNTSGKPKLIAAKIDNALAIADGDDNANIIAKMKKQASHDE